MTQAVVVSTDIPNGVSPLWTEITLTAAFTLGGVAADPIEILLWILTPDGLEAEFSYSSAGLIKSSTGVYSYALITDQPGWWKFAWQGVGNVTATADARFWVNRSIASEPPTLAAGGGQLDFSNPDNSALDPIIE